MAIKVTDAKGAELYTITTEADGKTVKDVMAKPGADAPFDATQLTEMLKGQKYSGDMDLQQLIASIRDLPVDPSDNQKATGERMNMLYEGLKKIRDQIAKLEAKTSITPDEKKQLQMLKGCEKLSTKELTYLMDHLKAQDAAKLDANTKATMAKVAKAEGMTDQAAGSGKAQMASGPQAQHVQGAAQTVPQQPYPGQGKATTVPMQGNPFDLNSFLTSSMVQGLNLNSMDQVGKSQAEQKKMMMLFMYFAMMAMSGDVGAMTAFMQFITTIIQKDKAALNIGMANKLIELEDANRKSVDILVNTVSYDPNNPQVGHDFAKVMERVKADQGSIATSQKLIAQMMEDFAQVSEFLNNLQKSMLDVRGRLLSRLSTFNA